MHFKNTRIQLGAAAGYNRACHSSNQAWNFISIPTCFGILNLRCAPSAVHSPRRQLATINFVAKKSRNAFCAIVLPAAAHCGRRFTKTNVGVTVMGTDLF